MSRPGIFSASLQGDQTFFTSRTANSPVAKTSLTWILLYETEDDRGNLIHRSKTLREEQRTADGYRLLWIHSLVKQTTDGASRMKAINKTVDELIKLRHRLQSPRSRMRDRHRVEAEVEKILTKRSMEAQEIESLPLYPEERSCRRPTTRRVIDAMESVSRHRLVTDEGVALDLYTDPTALQTKLMKLFGIKPSECGR